MLFYRILGRSTVTEQILSATSQVILVVFQIIRVIMHVTTLILTPYIRCSHFARYVIYFPAVRLTCQVYENLWHSTQTTMWSAERVKGRGNMEKNTVCKKSSIEVFSFCLHTGSKVLITEQQPVLNVI